MQNDDGKRKPVDASKKKRIVRSVSSKLGCYDITSRNRNVKRRGS
jgi:hypothetical protein